MAKKYLTLQEVDADKSSSLWVLNKTDPRGTVNMSMPDGLGGTLVMMIPITWIPIDLTTQATKESLLKSPTFRKLVTAKKLLVLSEKDALAELDSEDAKNESQRVYTDVEFKPELRNAEVEKLESEEHGKVSGFAMNIVCTDLTDDKLITMLKSQDGVLTEDDYKYIAANSQSSKVKEYCAQQLTVSS